MNNINIELDFSENIFNDAGNGDIEFDVSDYCPDFDIKVNELTFILLIQVLEDFINTPVNKVTNEVPDDEHLSKKQRK
jgi:hypothetical protein